MKKLTAIIIVLAAMMLAAGIVSAAPRLTIPEDSFDFGYVPQHSKISHVFWLYSTGDDSLKVVKVKPG